MAVTFRAVAACTLLSLAIPLPALAQGYGNAPAGSYNWSGWYVGGNAGWGWRNENAYPASAYYQSLGVFGYGSGTSYGTSTHDGFTAGGTLGYQYQLGHFVLGADYDFQYAGIANNPRYATTSFAKQTGTTTTSTTYTDPYTGITYTTITGTIPVYGNYTAGNFDPTDGDSNRWIGLARVRAGYAMDRWLLYATGGAAYRFSYSSSNPYVVQPNGSVITYSGYNEASAWGWVVGGGVEYGLSDWITTRVEYLHMDFGAATYIDPIATTALGRPITYKDDREVNMMRVGINFRFNFGGSAAKY
jgi:outer membrane immunogenic protein